MSIGWVRRFVEWFGFKKSTIRDPNLRVDEILFMRFPEMFGHSILAKTFKVFWRNLSANPDRNFRNLLFKKNTFF